MAISIPADPSLLWTMTPLQCSEGHTPPGNGTATPEQTIKTRHYLSVALHHGVVFTLPSHCAFPFASPLHFTP
jgi:hypothetical protein